MNILVYIWLGVLALMVVIEMLTTQLVTIWFAAGALVSFFIALAGVDKVWIQILAFVLVSAFALILTRPLVRKITKQKIVPTNADMVLGKTGIVTERVDNLTETGLVKVGGAVWTARSADGSVIEANTTVHIQEIRGVTLLVIKN